MNRQISASMNEKVQYFSFSIESRHVRALALVIAARASKFEEFHYCLATGDLRSLRPIASCPDCISPPLARSLLVC
jgi:hypothetical protein